MRRYTMLLAVPLLLAASCIKEPAKNPDPNHTHADFAMWIEGTRVDLADEKYMSEEYDPSHANDAPSSAPSSKQKATKQDAMMAGRKYLHLHDGNADVIHRHKPGLTLGEFLMSMGFTMSADCVVTDTARAVCNEKDSEGSAESVRKTWRMFVNGEEWPFDPAYDFKDVDQILLTYGSDDEAIASQLSQLTDEACLYSHTCPERGDPPTENCIADPAVPCVAPEE